MKQKDIHKDCIDHVKVEGYKKKICVLAGQSRTDVVQFAVDLLDTPKMNPHPNRDGVWR